MGRVAAICLGTLPQLRSSRPSPKSALRRSPRRALPFVRMLGAATFRDRAEAGARLGDRVAPLLASDDVDQPLLVLGLPRGGVVVAAEVVRALRSAGIDASLDVF